MYVFSSKTLAATQFKILTPKAQWSILKNLIWKVTSFVQRNLNFFNNKSQSKIAHVFSWLLEHSFFVEVLAISHHFWRFLVDFILTDFRFLEMNCTHLKIPIAKDHINYKTANVLFIQFQNEFLNFRSLVCSGIVQSSERIITRTDHVPPKYVY